MKLFAPIICTVVLWAGMVLAESPVILKVDTRATGAAIPDDFIGLSFGMKALPGNKAGAHLFSATNTTLVTLFQNIGLRHMRVGGTDGRVAARHAHSRRKGYRQPV